MRTRLIAGNWKMNRTAMETEQFLGRFDTEMGKAELLICMPFTDLYLAEKYLAGTGIKWGAQNVYPAEKGAFTGEISPGMLKETGCSYVICGHSERRQILCESDEFVGKKVKIVLAYGMTPILCVGETLEERESGQMKTRLLEEMRAALSGLSPEELLRTVIAYEPVWAIGTGKNASPEDADAIHSSIRKTLAALYGEKAAKEMIIQYGGSMKPENAAGLLKKPNIDGGLIGGAGLKTETFLPIALFSE